jgi:hypothetical protein
MILVPLAAVPSQSLSIQLGGQPCQITVRTLGTSLYFSLLINDEPIVQSRICRNRQRLLLDARYKGFVGDFMFIDTFEDEQPSFPGLGTRWFFFYLSPNE